MNPYPSAEDLLRLVLRVAMPRAARHYAPVAGGRYLSVTSAAANTACARLGGEQIGCGPCTVCGIYQTFLNCARVHMRSFFAVFAFFLAVTSAWALKVTITVRIESEDNPVVVGATNLPDGTELMVTIRRKESAYMAQDKTRVSNGAFRAGPFSQKGASLSPGVYTIEISSPLASLQPPAVRAVIGRDGSNLEGPLAKNSKVGGKVVEYQTSFKVGGGKFSTDKDRAARAQAEKDRHAWWLQSCKDNCNLVQGVARKRGEPFDWNRCYNKCVSEEPKRK